MIWQHFFLVHVCYARSMPSSGVGQFETDPANWPRACRVPYGFGWYISGAPAPPNEAIGAHHLDNDFYMTSRMTCWNMTAMVSVTNDRFDWRDVMMCEMRGEDWHEIVPTNGQWSNLTTSARRITTPLAKNSGRRLLDRATEFVILLCTDMQWSYFAKTILRDRLCDVRFVGLVVPPLCFGGVPQMSKSVITCRFPLSSQSAVPKKVYIRSYLMWWNETKDEHDDNFIIFFAETYMFHTVIVVGIWLTCEFK